MVANSRLVQYTGHLISRTFMNLKEDLSPGSNIPDSFNVVVEIPKGSQNKYEYDPEQGVFVLDRVLFSPLHYPGDYGFIPQTLAKDNDPLDVLVLVTHPTQPGMVMEVRPIGVLEFIDSGEDDDKLLCVPVTDIRFRDTQEIGDIPEPILDEIAHFFSVYKQLENKSVEIRGWHDSAAAKKIVTESIERYKNH